MASENFVVPARSWDEIALVADRVRSMVGLGQMDYVPIVDTVEMVLSHAMRLFDFEIGTYADMDGAEGLTDPNGQLIIIREDVYEKAIHGDGRARFTIAHELGHYFLHVGMPLQRCGRHEKIAPYRRSEPQANQFAAEFLMPRNRFRPGSTKVDLMRRHGVSEGAAQHRISFLSRRGALSH